MPQFGFFIQHTDISTHPIPTTEYIEAETMRDAMKEMCKRHGLKPESWDGIELWVTLKDGRNVSYIVKERDDNGKKSPWILKE